MALLPAIKAVLRRRRVPAKDASDLAHDLLISLLPWAACRTSDELRAPFDLCKPYVLVAAARCARHHLRREARRGERLGWEPDQLGHSLEDRAQALSPEDLLLEHEAAAALATEVDLDWLRQAVTPELWRAFHAYYIHGTPVPEIAAAEQIPIPTVYNRLRLARVALRAAILRRRAAARRG